MKTPPLPIRFPLAAAILAASGAACAAKCDEACGGLPVDLPAAVAEVVVRAGGGEAPAAVERVVREGREVFEASFYHEGARTGLFVTPEGEVLESQRVVALKELPPVVRQRLLARADGDYILEIQRRAGATGVRFSADVLRGEELEQLLFTEDGGMLRAAQRAAPAGLNVRSSSPRAGG